MKKALALVLALVLALSVATSAFALELVTLKPATTTAAARLPLTSIPDFAYDEAGKDVEYCVAGKGGVYYVLLDNVNYKDIEVTASGVSAKVVEYDPTVFVDVPEIPYYVFDRVNGKAVNLSEINDKLIEATTTWHDATLGFKASNYYMENGKLWLVKADKTTGELSYTEGTGIYAHMVAVADALNVADKTTQYVVKTDANLDLIQITVEDNYSASYAEGQVVVNATLNGKAVSGKLVIVRDVTIWDYETVKSAAKYDKVLSVAADKGYSDYATYLNGYENKDLTGVSVVANPVVISTTAFRAIAGSDLTVVNGGLKVEIDEVQAGQKGVNFSAYQLEALNAKGKTAAKGEAVEIVFGFYGEQKVLGDFTITVDTGYNWFTLREAFGVKVEEDDIITYYILKDGKYYDEIEVDYMTIDPYKEVKLEIEGSNSNLGEYAIVLEVASTGAATEENPNTGAESVVGVVAALAVVSVATAAAVSLKK